MVIFSKFISNKKKLERERGKKEEGQEEKQSERKKERFCILCL